MKNKDMIIGAIITIFAVLGFSYVEIMDFKSEVGLSPGIFPQFIFVLMGVCGIVIFFEGRSSDESNQMGANYKKLGMVISVLGIYSYALEYIGFIISTIVFLATTLYIFEEKRLRIMAAVPIVASLLIYLLFTELFLIPLP